MKGSCQAGHAGSDFGQSLFFSSLLVGGSHAAGLTAHACLPVCPPQTQPLSALHPHPRGFYFHLSVVLGLSPLEASYAMEKKTFFATLELEGAKGNCSRTASFPLLGHTA